MGVSGKGILMYSKGRKRIYASYSPEELDAKAVAQILADAFPVHLNNASDIDYLHEYCKGVQPVLERTKQNRPEITNRIVENHAYEIVEFKTGYCFGQPIAYVTRSNDKNNVESAETKGYDDKVNKLNTLCLNDDKPSCDRELGDWLFECGVGYKAVFPLNAYAMARKEKSDAPFHISVLDPRSTFCVYQTDISETKLLSVTYTRKHSVGSVDTLEVVAYSDDAIFSASLPYGSTTGEASAELLDWDNVALNASTIFTVTPNVIGLNPIIEYDANTRRMGSFEPVIEMLDALNEMASNRADGVEQFVQSFVKFVNCDIDEETFTALKEMGAIKVQTANAGMPADVDIINSELNQDQTQTFVEDMYNKVLAIAGVPDRRASAGGNTGQALIIGQGWTNAESRALSFEKIFNKSERHTLRVVLRILQSYPNFGVVGIETSDVEIKFTRNRTDNLLNKSQGLINMLQAGIHPLIAIGTCGLFSDPESVFEQSAEYIIPKFKPSAQAAQNGSGDALQQSEQDAENNAQRQAQNDTRGKGDNNAQTDAQNKSQEQVPKQKTTANSAKAG